MVLSLARQEVAEIKTHTKQTANSRQPIREQRWKGSSARVNVHETSGLFAVCRLLLAVCSSQLTVCCLLFTVCLQ